MNAECMVLQAPGEPVEAPESKRMRLSEVLIPSTPLKSPDFPRVDPIPSPSNLDVETENKRRREDRRKSMMAIRGGQFFTEYKAKEETIDAPDDLRARFYERSLFDIVYGLHQVQYYTKGRVGLIYYDNTTNRIMKLIPDPMKNKSAERELYITSYINEDLRLREGLVHVPRLLDWGKCLCGNKPALNLTFEYYPVQLRKTALTIVQFKGFLFQVIFTLSRLRKYGFVHRDLRPHNIVFALTSDTEEYQTERHRFRIQSGQMGGLSTRIIDFSHSKIIHGELNKPMDCIPPSFFSHYEKYTEVSNDFEEIYKYIASEEKYRKKLAYSDVYWIEYYLRSALDALTHCYPKLSFFASVQRSMTAEDRVAIDVCLSTCLANRDAPDLLDKLMACSLFDCFRQTDRSE